MGTYPKTSSRDHRRLPSDGGEVWVEEINRYDGVLRYRKVYAGPWVEGERTDCFCCSCCEHHSDPFCRNHGWAGRRPCERHGTPGQADDEGFMPDSVQERRAR
jgi:hypothetical protein